MAKTITRRDFLKGTAASAFVLAMGMAPAVSASTEDLDWPESTINFYVTHAAGGDTDYMARQLATALEEVLDTTIVCTNVTGANGATCMTQYKDGDTDGYTFILTNSAALNGNQATGMVDFGYDSFEVVAVYGMQSGENIVVPADSPYDTLQDLIDASQESPYTIKYGISTGGGVYMMAAVLVNLGGAQLNIIDAGDASERLTALLGGEVDATSLPYSTAADYIEDGQMKSLCTCLSEAPTLLPDQPTASETVEEMQMDTEYVILAPKGTSEELVAAMNAAILEATSTDEWKEIVNEYSFQDPFVLDVEESLENISAQAELFMSFVEFLE